MDAALQPGKHLGWLAHFFPFTFEDLSEVSQVAKADVLTMP